MNIQSLVWTIDLNNDGSYSAWEILETVRWVFRIPGNLILEALGNTPYLSSLLHIEASAATGYNSLNGSLASSLSLIVWALALVGILTLASPSVIKKDRTSEPLLIGSNVVSTTQQLAAPAANSPHTASSHHVHLPVSRSNYAMPGTKPIRHKRHRRLIIT